MRDSLSNLLSGRDLYRVTDLRVSPSPEAICPCPVCLLRETVKLSYQALHTDRRSVDFEY